MPTGPGVLVARRFDGLLVGWLAVALWVGVMGLGRLGVDVPLGVPVVFWTGAAVTAAHFALSYHLAYQGGFRASVRRHPIAFAVGPAVIAGALAVPVAWSLADGRVAAVGATRAMVTGVYLMTTWHYVKQVYGVGRVGAAFAGIKLTKREADALRYGLYPMWWLGAAAVLVQGPRGLLAGFEFGYPLLPRTSLVVLRALAWVAAAGVGVAVARACRRAHRLPSSVFLAPYVAAVLWLTVPTSPVLLFALLAPMHALQYLAVGHRAEVALAAARPGEHGWVWWLNLFGGAAAAGLLVSRWLPLALDHRFDAGQGPLLFTAAVFVFLNLHHYLIDAVIWRSSGDLVKAVVRGPAAVVPAQRPAALPTPHPAAQPA